MKIVIFTSNAIRHKFVANTLIKQADDALVISECKESDAPHLKKDVPLSLSQEHFSLRYQTEKKFFAGNDWIEGKVFPILHKEVNSTAVYSVVKDFAPDMAFVFGSWLIRDRLLNLIPKGRFVNMHLGLSPYYRGSGTNFWPFVNKELQYVGSTLLHIDAGIDTGDIIAHVRPQFESTDTVHTAGCKVIESSAQALVTLMNRVKNGEELTRVKQWAYPNEKVYKGSDCTDDILRQYYKNIEQGIVSEYLSHPEPKIELIDL